MKTLYYLSPIISTLVILGSCQTQSRSEDLINNTSEEITTEQEFVHYPVESDANLIKILETSTYHEDEIDPSIRNVQWMELIRLDNTFAIVNGSISLKRVYDPVLDEENEMTGWEVVSRHGENSILLIEKYPFLKEHQVNAVTTDLEFGFNEEKTFQFNNQKYRLFSTGNKEKESNFQLFLESEKNGKIRQTLLVSIPQFDSKNTFIHFIGDIDNDGKLDFLIDTSNHYNVQSLTLFLSQPTDESTLCIPVGQITSVGC